MRESGTDCVFWKGHSALKGGAKFGDGRSLGSRTKDLSGQECRRDKEDCAGTELEGLVRL